MNHHNISLELSRHLDKIRDEDTPVIVEGRKDKAALECFGLRNIFVLDRALFEIAEEVAGRTSSCCVLTDLDSEGKRLFSKLRSELQDRGVRIDNNFRNFLFRKTSLREIEGIAHYFSHSFPLSPHNLFK